jgi:uncharacterized protein (TIGR04222 family)
MDFLSDNPLANMRGPDFLVLYAVFACIAVMTIIALAALDDDGRDGQLPQISAKPDPYELAYLRDGAGGVVWLAIYALQRAGLVELTNRSKLQRLGSERPSNRYETAVLSAIGPSSTPATIIRDRSPGGSVSSLVRSLESSLAARGLVRSPESRTRTVRVAWCVGGVLAAIAAYKVIVATTHGHRNVGGLLIECAISLTILLLAARLILRRRANTRGRVYLDRVKLAYERPRPNATAGASAGVDPANMLLVGVYGFQVLTGTPDAAFAKQAQLAQSSGGDGGGSSCGGGGGSGCGGGGGCGGCSSS